MSKIKEQIMNIQLSNEDEEMFSCLNSENPQSFFLYAGAGTGKTRSLVSVLQKFREENIDKFRLNGKKIAVITFTNAACDEIKRRLDFDSSFMVSTIHSFSWELIRHFQSDINHWVRVNAENEIVKLECEQKKGRAGTQTSMDRGRRINAKKRLLQNIQTIKKFSYSPNGANNSDEELNHADVIKIASEFLRSKNLMKRILVEKHPILLIDECQDTKKELIEALLDVQLDHSSRFSLGLFGDTMQRIYMDGKKDIETHLPNNWKKPIKNINYRSPKRLIKLINKIRGSHPQIPSKKSEEGVVKLFIVDSDYQINRNEIEQRIANEMASFTSDEQWKTVNETVKKLILEHHMAARRGGFLDFFKPLYEVSSDSTGLLDGTMPGISFLLRQLIPLVESIMSGNDFIATNILKNHSPLLEKNNLSNNDKPMEQIQKAKSALGEIKEILTANPNPSIYQILCKIKQLNLLILPDVFQLIEQKLDAAEAGEDEFSKGNIISKWYAALQCPYTQAVYYSNYISNKSCFGTHQGVKGLEFPRVMAILDDHEAKGFLFSYEKLLGAKDTSVRDKTNIREGKETSIDRTKRLFYVICSRAEKSLAIVAYTKNPMKVKEYAINNGWFCEDEVITDFK